MVCPLHFIQISLSMVVYLSCEHLKLTSPVPSPNPPLLLYPCTLRGAAPSILDSSYLLILEPNPRWVTLSNVLSVHPRLCSFTLTAFDQNLDYFESLLICPFCIQFGLFNLMKNDLLNTYLCVSSYKIVINKMDMFLHLWSLFSRREDIHLFITLVFIEHFLCTSFQARSYIYSSEQINSS